MSSTAITAQRSVLAINSASGTALVITAVSKANPGVVTYTGTDPANGNIGQIDAVAGMVELNGRAYKVQNVNVGAKTFELAGVDTTNYTTYVSGGTFTPKTMTTVGNIKDFQINQDKPAEINVTNLASTRKEFRIGLAGSWTASCSIDVDTSDAGQAELTKAQNDGLSRVFTLTLSSGKVFAGVGYVMSFDASGSPDAVVGGKLEIRGTGQPTWFA